MLSKEETLAALRHDKAVGVKPRDACFGSFNQPSDLVRDPGNESLEESDPESTITVQVRFSESGEMLTSLKDQKNTL